MKNTIKNPLILCCIIGILVGYAASFVVDIDQNRLLTIGLIGGLVVGYILDAQAKKKNNQEPSSPKELIDSISGGKASEEARKTMDETADLLASARANMNNSAETVQKAAETTTASAAAPSGEETKTAGQEKIDEMEDLFKSARQGMDK